MAKPNPNINFIGLDGNGEILIANPNSRHPTAAPKTRLPANLTVTQDRTNAKDYNYVTDRELHINDMTSAIITLKMEDSFRDFEPLRCGASAVPDNTYMIKNGANYKAPEYQSYVNNGFSNLIQTNDYKINGQPIKGFEVGTVPMAACPNITTFICGDSTIADIYVDVAANGAKTLHIVKNILLPDSEINLSFPESYFSESARGERVFPKRIGIVLVGGGGGAGGWTWYDAEKNGKDSDQFVCAGSGGGGGGIIWGVLDLTEVEARSTDKINYRYRISIAQTKLTYRSSDWEKYMKDANNGSTGFNFSYTLYNKCKNDETDQNFLSCLKKAYNSRSGEFCTWKKFSDYFKNSESDFNYAIKKMGFNIPSTDMSGKSGINATRDGLTHNSRKCGTDGYAGANIVLSEIKLEYPSTYNDFCSAISTISSQISNLSLSGLADYIAAVMSVSAVKVTATELATAFGGAGGGQGNPDNSVNGGGGGSSSHPSSKFVYVGHENGGAGAGAIKDTETATLKKDFYVQFLNDETTTKSLSVHKTADPSTSSGGATENCRIPGGNSWGRGATANSIAGSGGGGCCGANSSGGDPYWALYY